MKIFNIFTLSATIIAISSVFGKAVDNQITYYGCPDNCKSQQSNSCGGSINTEYFAALATRYPHVNSQCGQYVIVMPANGSKKLVKAKVVDTCGSCDPYHVDLSIPAFTSIVEKKKGIAEVIWAIYSPSGKKIGGPYCNNFDSAASKVGMSRSAYVAAFEASAERLAKSGSNTGTLSSSGATNQQATTKVVTVNKPATQSIQTTQNPSTKSQATPVATPKQPAVASSPEDVINSATKTVQNDLKSTTSAKPTATVSHPVNSVSVGKKDDNGSNIGTKVGIITAVGGTLGAAGVGLLLMKKKSPNTYEDLKQKFPDAFGQVKRGISRGATALKRKVTKKTPNPNVEFA